MTDTERIEALESQIKSLATLTGQLMASVTVLTEHVGKLAHYGEPLDTSAIINRIMESGQKSTQNGLSVLEEYLPVLPPRS